MSRNLKLLNGTHRWQWLLCLTIVASVTCSGCAGGLLRLGGLVRIAGRGAAVAGGEAAATSARLAMIRPTAFRAGVVAMDEAAVSRIALRQQIAATPQEISMARAAGLDHLTPTGQVFLRQLTAVDSQMSTLVLADETFAGMKAGQRVFTSVTSGAHTRTGWVRKLDNSTIVFNDGVRDLMRSEAKGAEVLHYSLRSGRPELLGRTLKSGEGLSFDTWDSEMRRYVTSGYARKGLNSAWEFYYVDGHKTGTLFANPIALTDASQLPASSIVVPSAIGAGAVMALGSRFVASNDEVSINCSYLTSADPQAVQCDRARLDAFAEQANRIGYTVVMADAAGITPNTFPSRDPNYTIKAK